MRLFTNAFTAFAILACALATSASAQPYPARDITFIVAFAPGGVADTVARFVAQGVGAKLAATYESKCC
jgi:tripartite-type tricarboxylate transporter receptor subunit TctC